MIDIHRLSFGAADQGLPLPPHVLRRMELLFGTSFESVRVHIGPEPASLGTRAFVHGSDIYIDARAYDPETADGWETLGHELAHVRQTRRGWKLAPEGVGLRLLQDPTLEAEAARMAALARRAWRPEATVPLARRPPTGPHRWDLLLT
ncbi:MAG: DUF4157 domain-containing protein [Rubrivivax sp.]|nr:DUF4157 domain-containing protein [Rubrivivax sp.]